MSSEQLVAGEQTRNIWRLAWPQTLMMFFHFWIGFIDVYVAGQLNDQIQASLGLITQTLFFLLIIAMAMANGAISSMSQSLGAGKVIRAQRYCLLSIGLVFGLGVLLGLIGYALRGVFLDLLYVPVQLRTITDYFLQVFLLLLPVYYLFIVSNAVFRAQKKVFIPLIGMIICTLVNTMAGFGLSLGLWGLPELGYRGLAWATFFSVSCGCLFVLICLIRQGWLNISKIPAWKWIKKASPYLWKVAWPAGMMQVLWHTAFLVLFAITASLPSGKITALAALTAGLRIESILFLPAVAFNMTASILVGHYLGSGDVQGGKKIGLKTWALGCTIITLMGGLVWMYAPFLAEILSRQESVQAEILNYLYFNILAIPFTGTSLIIGGIFIGAGATRYNMLCVGGSVWGIRLPLAYVLGHVILSKAIGIWVAMLVSQFIQASFMFGILMYKDWTRFSMMARKLDKQYTGVQHGAHFPTTFPGKTERV